MKNEAKINPHANAGLRAKAATQALRLASEGGIGPDPQSLDSLVPLSGEETACRDALLVALQKFEAR